VSRADVEAFVRSIRLGLTLGLLVLLAANVEAQDAQPGPWKQLAKLTEAKGKDQDGLGSAVAISKDGKTAAVGAAGWCPVKKVDGCGQGAIFVFAKPASGWADMTETARLLASDGQPGEYLGASVAISDDGSTVVAGAPYWPADGKGNGAAYVFVKPKSGWMNATETAQLRTTDGAFAQLGQSVAISGHTIVGGGYGFNGLQGAAYVFVEPNGGWVNKTQTARLTPSDGPEGEMGYSVAMSGDTVVAGAPSANGQAGNGAYVFVKPKSGWKNRTETAKLTASRGTGFKLGRSVSISADTVVVGGPEKSNGNGAVYVYVQSTQGWQSMTESARLMVPPKFNFLGYSVSIDSGGKRIIAGAPGWQDGGAQGAADLFDKPVSGWRTTSRSKATLIATDGENGDDLGFSVSSIASTVLAGAVTAKVGSHREQGAVYIFGQ
jgi:FG-GAP repeat